MNGLTFDSLGETWINLVNLTTHTGTRLGTEGYELLGVSVEFPSVGKADPVIERFGDRQMIAEMKKVFLTGTPNSLGHSYARLMQGPSGRHDLKDVLELLHGNPLSKRSVVTLCGAPDGKVPCVNVIQFLIRAGAVQTMYYARGQDAFRKFYADGLCIATMAQTVANGLQLPAGRVTGFIASSHVYDYDLPAIRDMLAAGRAYLCAGERGGLR
jgi:thymidylate synthase